MEEIVNFRLKGVKKLKKRAKIAKVRVNLKRSLEESEYFLEKESLNWLK